MHTEETLKRSEDRFKELIRHLPDYIIVHQEGIIVFVNDTACEKLAYPKSEIMGTPILNFIDKDDHEKVVFSLMKRMKGEEVEDYEITIFDSLGNEHSAIVRSSIISFDGKPAVLSVLIDITERKAHEQQILESKARLNAILDNLPFKAWLKDVEGKFIAVNKPFAAYYNISKDEIVGKTDKDLCDKEIAKIFKEEDTRVIQTRKQSFSETQNSGMTEGEWYETFKSPIFDNEGNVIGITGIARDITEQKQRQNELIKAKEDADAANIAKQQFLSTMSHEIRTPLNAIIGMSNLLIEEDPKDDQLENLEILKYSANHLLSLISDILDFSKIEAGKIDLEENDFNINELLYGFIKMFKVKAAEKNLDLDYRLSDDVPENLIGDYVRLNQILTNLVGNAIKFTERGRVNLCVDLENRSKKECVIRFEVLDTGVGIDNDDVNEIFESFVQTGASSKSNLGGTGLGLAIAKKLVDLQGGKIEVNSIPGKGSSFIFDMPYKISSKKNIVLNRNRAQKFELLKNVRVLLVEDNLINQIIAGKYLMKWGAIVDEAENGLIAFEKVKNNKYDVILMDLQMPEMNGYEATRSIRGLTDSTRNNIPIIALTASAFLDVRDEVYKSGMNDFLTKPFNPEELNKKILQLLRKEAS
ncbi:PAS domain S-box protein [Bacteroidota bacterium]